MFFLVVWCVVSDPILERLETVQWKPFFAVLMSEKDWLWAVSEEVAHASLE